MTQSTPGAATEVSGIQLQNGPSVNNSDIAGIINRLNDFIIEVLSSVSANSSYFNVPDTTRFNSYLSYILKVEGWAVGQPPLDLPKTSPRSYQLVDYPVIVEVNNEDINDMVRLLALERDELSNSQSALDGSGLNAYDDARFKAVITKAQNFMANVVAATTPVDMPSAQPLNPITGAGASTATAGVK